MQKGNQISSPNISAQLLEQILSDAKICHQRSKDGAAEAVAKTYMLWVHTQSTKATSDSREWLSKAIESANETIAAHNSLVKARSERVSNFKDGKLPDNDPILAKPTSEKHRQEIEADKEGLRAKFGWKPKDWNKLRKVMIAAKDGSSVFNKIVKFTFSFDEPHHSDDVARYCMVLDWVHAQFTSNAPADAQGVFDAIKLAGGFEKVLADQRGAKNNDGNGDDREAMTKAIRQDIKSMLESAAPIATIEMEAQFAHDGYVAFIGRKRAFVEGVPAQVDVISEIMMTEAEINFAIESYGANTPIPNSSNSEFVARVLQLGNLVPEGLPTQATYDDTVSGEKAKTQRVLSFRPQADAGPQFVISARRADVSPVIYVEPRGVKDLGEPITPMMLGGGRRRRIEHLLRDRNARRHISIVADQDPVKKDGKKAESPMAWRSGNDVLMEKSSENATQQFYWSNMANIDHKPLDIENFNAQFSTAIDDTDVSLILNGPVKEWEKSTSSTKHKFAFSLTFDANKLILQTGEKDPYEYKLRTSVSGRYTLSIRAKDMMDLLKQLAAQDAAEFQLEGDEGGLLRVTWSDRLGRYTINMPTATRDGGWTTRRVAPMRINAPKLIAAE